MKESNIRSVDRLLIEREAAWLLRIAQKTLEVWRHTKRYDLPYVKIGHLVRYRPSDIEAFIQRRMIGGGSND